ncbi:MAG: universal stress protein [Myxococcales bacterium]|nr:universal stress protein [Myxococcales bacterium]
MPFEGEHDCTTEPAHAKRSGAKEPRQESAGEKSRYILVAVNFGVASRAALRWASELSEVLGLELRFVHAVPTMNPESRGALRDGMRESLRGWAAAQVGVSVSQDAIRVEEGSPLEVILRESSRPDVEMVVVGGPLATEESGRSEMLHALLRQCPLPLFVVGPRGQRSVIVAATDGRDPALPIVQQAASMADLLGDKLVTVHNADTALGPSVPPLEGPQAQSHRLTQQIHDWLVSRVGSGLVITQEPSTASAVISTARALQADLIVVGVRPSAESLHHTADELLAEARRTVLFVPLSPKTQ